MRLYSNFVNSAGERVRIALALKQLDYEYVSVRALGWDAYKQINPQGLMPALEIDGRIFAQSTAILEYLEETYPERSLLPDDPVLRGQARAFGQHIASEMHAVDVIRIRRFLHQSLGIDRDGLAKWQAHWFETGFKALEEELRRRETVWPYCFGDAPGWADLHLVPQMRKGLTRFGVNPTSFSLLKGVYDRCIEHPAFIAAAPDRQPDYDGAFVEPPLTNPEGIE